MIDQDLLQDLTESYLKTLISEESGSLSPDFDSSAAFGELGINSFQVLKIIKKLEADFGTLPKSLLFENFNINDLANYFVGKHEMTLSTRFAERLRGVSSVIQANDRQRQPAAVRQEAQHRARTGSVAAEAGPILILEKDAYAHPELKDLVGTLFARYKVEGCVSRGTRLIAPNLFIGSARQGFFNYGRSKSIILVYGYTGPRDYLPVIFEELYQHCAASGRQLNILADEQIPAINGTPFSATPFGVLQRIVNLREFTLDGGPMRRLRYQISKFLKSGRCRTEEYRCGSARETDTNIVRIIDRWCESRTVVNPLVHEVRAEIAGGTLGSDHRMFLTYLDDVLQNVILITAMCAEQNGYLMDLEFYLPDMPLGGLEFAIGQIIDILVREECDVLSLGGTYGCKLEPSASADPEIDRILDELRAQSIFNDEGNLQFKNKFRPESKPIFLCRPLGSANPDNVIDIIMMIADPLRMQTPDEENHTFSKARSGAAFVVEKAVANHSASLESRDAATEPAIIDGDDRSRVLSEAGFNPLNIPPEHVELDLKTDSWAQLEMPAIKTQMRHLHGQLQQPVNVDSSLRAVFPFTHFVLTASGQAAEHLFFKAWPKQGVVPQNLLFPSTILHQIDNGFSPRELPHPEVFRLNAAEPYKGNMAWDALETEVAQDPTAISFVCIEVANNAAGGNPVSMQHLRDVKALLAGHSIPLVIDATRVVENAQFLIEQEKEYAGHNLSTVVRDILSCADAVIGSLTKDFCVNKGGIIATNDVKLFQRLQELAQEESAGIDLIDRKLIALSLQNRKHFEANVLRRMENVRLIWRALKDNNVPVVQPAGGHCILIDVRQIPEFRNFQDPLASFLAWLYVNTGIRAGAHSVGMQKQTPINDLVRLAVPVGLKRDQIDSAIDLLIHAFAEKVNIPEIIVESSAQPLGGIYAKYKLLEYHNVSKRIVSKADDTSDASSLRGSLAPAQAEAAPAENVFKRAEAVPAGIGTKTNRVGDVAIIGMAGRYPKAKNLAELWDNLAGGRDCIEEIPSQRYERRLLHRSTAKYRGGFIDDVDRFDSLFFNISPREAEMLDPQERLLLEVAWEVIEDAGYYPEIVAQEDASRSIGVFVGAVWAMYQMLGVEEKHLGNTVIPNSFLWSIANRISYALNLSGPSLTVDTACSSSLTAIYLACEAIQSGQCSAAIVGGVNLDLHQAKFDINHQGGALSADGVCRTFGKGANGYVMGEGIGALFLKPLDQAVQDGDNIYGVIKSAVVNHGGRTSGYTVPSPKAQADLVAAALEKASIDARSIGYVEAHGTGTELGDPIEIAGLSSAFQSYTVGNQACAIGSVKTNIGHLEAAAGVVGVSKVLLQMKHRQLVPSLHSSELNEFIDFEHSPFYVVQRLEEWKAKELDGTRLPLRAGISSFGAGGSNAHVILESYEPVRQAGEEPTPARALIFTLSARNEDQLREAAVRLTKFLQQNAVDPDDVAYTLQQGRKSFEHRLAIIARTKEELIEKLGCFVDGKKNQDISIGHAKGGESLARLLNRRDKQEFIRLVSEGADPHKMAGLWTEGLLSDWQGSHFQGPGKRISLPTYPFADKRHWASASSPAGQAFQPVAGVHPMVDTNESTFERQLFKKTFHDRDFFIYDHRVSDIPTLPGVAYLELARKAGEIAAGRKVRKIRNILWISPIAIQNSIPKEVFIELKPSGNTVQFEVFSEDAAGHKTPHSQGKLLFETSQDSEEPEYIDLDGIRSRCEKVIDGKTAYPLFKSFGLNLGPSFQVLQDVYKNELETLGVLKLPEFREADLQSMVLQPSLIDGSLQAGVAAQVGGQAGEMVVPFSIGEVEILQPLQTNCLSYVTATPDDRGGSSRVVKSNVLIVDETGKILVKIRESVGVPLREVHKQSGPDADADGFSRLYYSYDWQKLPLAAEPATQGGTHSLVLFAADEALRESYLARLRDAGTNDDQVILVRPGEAFEDSGNQSYTINSGAKDDFTRLFEAILEKGCPVENICFAWSIGVPEVRGDQELNESLERGVYSFLFLCQALINQKLESAVQLLFVHSVREGQVQPHNEAVSGFINTLRLEHPKLLCKTLEIRQESVGYEEILDAITAEIRARLQDANVVRYQGRERFIRRLKAFDLGETAAATPSPANGIRENGVYLITGGAGGLGLIFAEFLAKEHKARVVLSGRSTLSAEREAALEELRKAGAEVVYLPADMSNRDDVRKLIDESKSHFGTINGVIHAAGVLRDSLIRNKTAEEMRAVFAPKIYGTRHLDELTKNEDLDFFVTFSSLAAVAGNGGQCDYSFANHFMDSFAAERELRRAEGARSGKTLSFNWSIWADGGMKLDEQTELMFRKIAGIRPLSAETGLDAFVRGLASDRSQFAVLEGLQEKVELVWGLRKKPAAAPAAPTSKTASSSPASTPVGTSGEELSTWLQNELTQIVMELLKLDAGDVAQDKILLDLGFDSIGLTTFANAVNEKYQLDITPVLFFDYPSISEIAKYLSVERQDELLRFHGGSPAGAPVAKPQALTEGHVQTGRAEGRQAPFEIRKGWDPTAFDMARPRSSDVGFSPELRFVNEPIAIVGMSGVMPQSEDLDEFWENLKSSTDMVTVIPEDRWKWEDYHGDPLKEANKSSSRWGGFMKEVDKFDPLFFGISPREAQMMDPQQRIFLETVWKAIEDSGQKVSDLSGTKTGLFVGVATNDYADVLRDRQAPLDGYTASGNSHSVLANRVSFLLNLRGPSAPIDTACSSSLVALHRAIESIHTRSCDMAIVGGVQVMLSPAAYISFSAAGMLSPDGKCKTFDKRANGYVRGEGSGAIYLKRLSAAEADGNHIYAVIKATAENHGGKVTTLTAPNSSAQSELLIEAYEKAQIDPATVGFIECHGTGTSLGDPIEIQALTKAFSELYKKRNRAPATAAHCGLSSVKTNIGHLETAAGIAGILKALLAIEHKQIPANVHFEELNPYINLKGTPFYIADKLTPWEAPIGEDGLPAPRRAGVSSFGFGGANAHIVLEEYIPARHQSPASAHEPQLIVLSARNEDRLRAYVRSMLTCLDKRDVGLIDLAYTLQVGRDEMQERLAFVASDTEDLKRKFEAILGGEAPVDSYRNNVARKDSKSQAADRGAGEPAIEALIEGRELAKLAELWVSGAKIDWRQLYKPGLPRRISVPTYPFARERHWTPAEENKKDTRRGETAPVLLHPLIHRNTSTLQEQKFSSRFSGEEFYLADHVVETHKILPGVAYLEMARAAGELSANAKVRVIRNLTWERPLVVESNGRDVEVSLAPGRNEVKFAVRSGAGESAITHCAGRMGYQADVSGPEILDIAGIKSRCSEKVLSGSDLYPVLSSGGLKLGRSFQIVQSIYATESESLAILQLPEHLQEEAGQYWLHPALMDGSLHTAIGLVMKGGMDLSLALPYSVGEVQIFHPLQDLYYGYATWAEDPRTSQTIRKVNFHLLDRNGKVLVRIKDFVSRPLQPPSASANLQAAEKQPKTAVAQAEVKAGLQSFLPVWNPVSLDTSTCVTVQESSKILLLGSDPTQLDWIRTAYPGSEFVDLASTSNAETIEKTLADCSFDQLLWIAPDVHTDPGSASGILDGVIEQQEEGVLAVFRIIKALLHLGYANRKLQWTIITSRTQSVTEGEPIQPAHAGIAGLVGSLAKEYPQWDLRLLDLDSLAAVPARECLSLPWDKQGNVLANRKGEWFQQGLALMTEQPQEASTAYRQNGVYVVIGGAGGVGEVWSRFMIENYQANIVWIGRRECNAEIEEKINSLARLGPAPLYVSADATNAAALEQACKAILEAYPAIHGVVHSAIVLQDRSIARMDEAAFRGSLSAKVDVSVNMDRVFGGHDLDFMLFFSSIIAFFKTPGQSNYSAGCTFKDSFAHSLQQRRAYPIKIMNWGYWGSVGVVADETHNKIMAQLGLGSIEPQEGMESLRVLVGSGLPQLALIKTLSTRRAAVEEYTDVKAMDVPSTKSIRMPDTTSPSVELNEELSSGYVRRLITEKISEAVRIDAALIGRDTPFAEVGVDSIAGINFLRMINEALQIELEATSLFEYSTVDQLSAYILKNWRQQIAAQVAPAAIVAPSIGLPADKAPAEADIRSSHRFMAGDRFANAGDIDAFEHESDVHDPAIEPIAIIGMSGRFAESESLDAFWQNLAEGKSMIRTVSRWSPADCVMSESPGRSYCSRGSFVDSIDQFDAAFFGISADEAVYMDPQQRLFLEEAWKALEDAGYAGKSVHEKQCGVYVGCGSSNYDNLLVHEPPAQAFWGNSQAVIPARIAYHLDLQGPAIAVDTACSSSLVTLHLACQGLWSRETEMALAGGVFVQATPAFYQVANQAGMLSPEGKCYSFDARANGFVPGEGVGVVVLKRLRDALRDGDHIHGVIAGSGINQDGRSNGLIAPNGRAQERLERAVYTRFGINPETIQVVEAHATGTVMGDSIEYGAISRSFREYTDKKQFCALGTVKTNIGHAATAAGVASVLKVLLSLKHSQIPPSLHFEKSNPAIDFASGPFYVNTELKDWEVKGGALRRAAISSFGFSGTNAHLVMEEAPSNERPNTQAPGYLVVLSARTAEQLKQQVHNLLALLKHTPGISMTDLSFSLFVGRTHFTHRLSSVARNQEDLIRLLDQWLETGAASQVYVSEIPDGRIREQAAFKKFGNYCIHECKTATDTSTYLENLAAVADLYAQGYSLDFQALFSGSSRRMPLPTYPFARERYWVDDPRAAVPGSTAATATAVQHVRTHTPNVQRPTYTPTFAGADEDLLAWLENELSQMVRDILTIESDDVSLDKVLLELGFDSLGLTKFAAAINESYQLDITPVLFFDHPSVGDIAKYLSEERESEVRRVYRDSPTTVRPAAPLPPRQRPADAGWSAASRPAGRRPSSERGFANEPIAIVGISGVMPQSDDLDAFWENLRSSKNLITVIPEDRWRWEDYFGDPAKEPNTSNSKWGGFINDVDKFDPLFFAISPREAQMMDPQQRIILETVWRAIEDSGQRVSDLSGTKTGVFIGVSGSDYTEVLRNLAVAIDGHSASGNVHSVLANRISFLLNLHGPSEPIDTACSSSLVALHRAVESIQAGSCEMAIVGGVQVNLVPGPYIAFSVAGMLSSDGKCRTFDKGASGYVRGEGCGAIFLKPLSAAEADGNPIYAVVKGTAENHGGRVTTLTAPNSAAQSALLIEAYEKARIDPATVGYIECHGTGTGLGDPIEAHALITAFSELYKRSNKIPSAASRCGLGSVKTNIGHLEAAAGIAGVLKVLLAIKHKQIPANIHFEELNPYINMEGTPFYVVDKLTPWDAAAGEDGMPVPRTAGVSSFGFGGANAHVVLQEYIPSSHQSPAAAHEPQLIVLSAKNEGRLEAYIRSMHAYLEKGEVELSDFAYTLQVGRDEMPERLAFVVSSTEELTRKFEGILSGARPEDSYRNTVRKRAARSQTADGADEAMLQALIERKELSKLADLWVSGAKIDWRLLYKAGLPRRISIPAYPFARERHWPSAEGRVVGVRQARPAKPLDHGAIKAVSPQRVDQPGSVAGLEEPRARLQSWVPVWKPVSIETSQRIVLPESTRILLLGGDGAHLDWLRRYYPGSEHLQLAPRPDVALIEEGLRGHSFDQLLWIAPDAAFEAGQPRPDNERIIDQQEDGVLAVFRIIKALLHSGYSARKLQWTVVTRLTQGVIEGEPIHPEHAGIAGLIGTLAQEYPHWDLRLLDVDSLTSSGPTEYLSLPWDRQGNALAHRRGDWFRQRLELTTGLLGQVPVYRQNGVYVVIGGAGGVGEVWSRYMIEHHQANVVWIGRRAYDRVIEGKINSLAALGHAPRYFQSDAADLGALKQVFQAIHETYPAVHGIVHSAVVLHEQSIARTEESVFRAAYSAKVDTSVNMDRVFGSQELDFMLFFSSIASFLKGTGLASYSAGCTFEDSFARTLHQGRPYPVKVMNWGHWGLGVAGDDAHNKIMAHMGVGAIEAPEGMASLDALIASGAPQIAVIKTFHGETAPGLSLSEAIAHHLARKSGPRLSVVPTDNARSAPPHRRPAELTEQMPQDYVHQVIVAKLSETLGLDAAAIASDTPVTDYGLDSISAVNLVRTINETLEIELEPSKLLEYNTVEEFALHISNNWSEQIAAHLARAKGQRTPAAGTIDVAATGDDAYQDDPFRSLSDAVSCSTPEQTYATPPAAAASRERILEMVALQDEALDESYERVTF